MPKAESGKEGLLDTWGRRNRKIEDKECLECGATFRPKRESAKYCSRPCMWKNNGKGRGRGESWWTDKKSGYVVGYVWIGDKRVFKRRHRWIMEGHLGRALSPEEVVHHINGDRQDNRLENLQIIEFGAHTSMHNLARAALSKAQPQREIVGEAKKCRRYIEQNEVCKRCEEGSRLRRVCDKEATDGD